MNKEEGIVKGKKGNQKQLLSLPSMAFLTLRRFSSADLQGLGEPTPTPSFSCPGSDAQHSRGDEAGGRARGTSVLEFVCPTTTASSQHSSLGNLLEKRSAGDGTKHDLVQQIYYEQLPPSILQGFCSLPSLMSAGNKPIFTGNS